jgi:hypothetical protein
VWDQTKGEGVIAPRMGTRQCVDMAKGKIIAGTEREIDSSMVDGNGQADIKIQPLA